MSVRIAALIGGVTALGVHAAPEVVAWGRYHDGTAYVPMMVPGSASNVVFIAAGGAQCLLLNEAGRVSAWGKGGAVNVPASLSNVVAIAAGLDHALALEDGGRVVAWGSNPYGQATVPEGLSNVVSIAAGEGHSLALTAKGEVVAWGRDWHGSGGGLTLVPGGLSNVVAIAGGAYHNLALTAGGRVVAWGAGEGEPSPAIFSEAGQSRVPDGLSNVVAIAAGYTFSLALTREGRVAAWGSNGFGQTNVPTDLSDVVAIAASSSTSFALTDDGQVVAWGRSLDDETLVPSSASNVVAIAGGGYHVMALTGLPPGLAAPARFGPRQLVAEADQSFRHRIQARNGVDSFGADGLPSGLVLDPRRGLIEGTPEQVGEYRITLSATNAFGSTAWTLTLFVNERTVREPTILSGGWMPAGLGCAFRFAVAARNDPQWFGARGLPEGLAIDASSGVISGVPVALGDYAASLITSNRYGLATGGLTLRVSPVVEWFWGHSNSAPPALPPGGLSNVVAIAARRINQDAGCSMALTAEGRVVVWGSNDYGQTNVPVALTNAVGIAAGGGHCLALTSEGRVVAWGTHHRGQIGVPDGLFDVVAIAAGGAHSLALTTASRVVAWGDDENGQASVPEPLSNVVAIAAGDSHSLALTAAGRVVSWGRFGQDFVPPNLSNVVAIAAGGELSLALTSGGRVVQWGFSVALEGPPDGLNNIAGIAASAWPCHALTTDGRVVSWATHRDRPPADYRPTVPVEGLTNVVAVAAGLVLLQQPTIPTPRLDGSQEIHGLRLQAHGTPGISTILLHASDVSGTWLPYGPVTFTHSVQTLSPREAVQPAQFFRLLRR